MSEFEAKFDNCFSPEGSVEVIENEENELELWIKTHDTRIKAFSTYRDQWGVFIHVHGHSKLDIAQEDKTRSFLDAMSQACQYLRTQCEGGTKPATT